MQSTLLKRRFEELNMNILKLKYYMNLKYEIVIQPSDDGYVVYITDLPGCITQCDSVDEILPMIEDAKKGWLEIALEDGVEILLPGKQK
jgi:antitoxin HicB